MRPHKFHVKPLVEDEDQGTFNAAGEYVPNVVSVRRAGADRCPDCSRGLNSRGDALVCSRLPTTIATKTCHDGCGVACGSTAAELMEG